MMLENIVNLLLGSSGRSKQLTEMSVKILLTLTFAVCSLPQNVLNNLKSHFINQGPVASSDWVPDLLMVIVFYFFYWYIFYVILPFVEAGFVLHKLAKGLKKQRAANADHEGAPNNEQPGRFVRKFFAYFGIMTPNGEPIGLGPIGMLIAPEVLKDSKLGGTQSILSDITSPFVVVEFEIIYLCYLRPWLGVSVPWTILFVGFGILLLAVFVSADIFRLFIRLFENQLGPVFQQLMNLNISKPDPNV